MTGTKGVQGTASGDETEIPLHCAAYLGFQELVKALLDGKQPIETKDEAGETALHLAAQNGRVEVVKVLLKGLANVSVQDSAGRTVLHHAALNGRLEVVEFLLTARGQTLVLRRDGEGFTALHLAAQSGEFEAVKRLLEAQVPVSLKAKNDGPTPLILGARSVQSDVGKVLLKAGADPKEGDFHDNGRTALHLW